MGPRDDKAARRLISLLGYPKHLTNSLEGTKTTIFRSECPTIGGGRVPHQVHVIAEFRGATSRRLDARVGKQANDDHQILLRSISVAAIFALNPRNRNRGLGVFEGFSLSGSTRRNRRRVSGNLSGS